MPIDIDDMALLGGEIDDIVGSPIRTPWCNGSSVSVSLATGLLPIVQSVSGAAIACGIATGESAVMTATAGLAFSQSTSAGLSSALVTAPGTTVSSSAGISVSGVLPMTTGTGVSASIGMGVAQVATVSTGKGVSASIGSGNSTVQLFSPTDITSPTLGFWAKADAIAGVNLDPVASWSDSSGNGHPATQATSSQRPSLRTAIINGMPIVRFDGADDKLIAASYRIPLATGFTAFIVFRLTTVHDGIIYSTASTLSGANGDFARFRNSAGTSQLRVATGTTFWDISCPATGAGYATITNGSTSSASGTLTMRLNGTQLLSQTVSRSTSTTQDMSLGLGSTSDLPLAADLAEIIIYHGVLSSIDRDKVEAYIRTKYTL